MANRPSLRELAFDVGEHFGVEPPSPNTVRLDLKKVTVAEATDIMAYGQSLLNPEMFPTWRALLFSVPGKKDKDGNGIPYETPEHQMAWFWCLYALVFKVEIPQWVIDYMGLPQDINEDFLSQEKLFTLVILAPPRHGKTELLLHTLIFIYLIDASKRVIYCSGIKATSSENMELVKMEFEHNDKLIELYGHQKPDDRQWNSKGFYLKGAPMMKTSNMYPIGMGSNVLSKDADLILVDDPQEQDEADSETQTVKMYKKLRSNLMTRREPHTPLLVVGSHQPSDTGDIFNHLEDDQGDLQGEGLVLHIVKTKAHDYEKCVGGPDDPHEICVLWPTVRPKWFLDALRKQLGDTMFEVCFNQEGKLGRIVYFEPDVLRGDYVWPEPDAQNRRELPELYEGGVLNEFNSFREMEKLPCHPAERPLKAIGVDPAASTRKQASMTAIVVLFACPACARRYLIDYIALRQSPERHPDLIMRFVESYRPQRVRIEKNAYQAALARDPRLINRQSEFGFRIDEWYTDTRKDDPEFGVPTVAFSMIEGRFLIPAKTEQDLIHAEEFQRSFIRYPNKPNDIPMATWLCELSIRDLLYEKHHLTPLVFEGWEGQPPAVMEEYEVDMSEIFDDGGYDVW